MRARERKKKWRKEKKHDKKIRNSKEGGRGTCMGIIITFIKSFAACAANRGFC